MKDTTNQSENKERMPRGIRNCNPLNIRANGTAWQGMTAEQTDKSFVQFKSMAYGFRAAFITLYNYMTKHRLTTIAQIVRRWAPESENNTQAYIDAVCQRTRIERNATLDWFDKESMTAIVKAMVWVENGGGPRPPLTPPEGGGLEDTIDKSIDEGYEMACKSYQVKLKK